MTASISTVGIVGTGVIGAGWAARCLARGLNVVASDPAPDAERLLREKIDKNFPIKLIHTVRGVGYVLKPETD